MRNDATAEQKDVCGVVFSQKFSDAMEMLFVSAREARQPDGLDVFLECGVDDDFRGRAQSCVDDFHPCVT